MSQILENYLDYLYELVRKPGEDKFERDVLQTHQAPYTHKYKQILAKRAEDRYKEKVRRQTPGHKVKRTKAKPIRAYTVRGETQFAPKTKEVRK